MSSSAVAIIKDGATSKISSASLDANGNIVAVDHDLQTMVVFTPVSQLYAGMHITIQRIVADEFPLVHLEVTVEDRAGNPIVGLDKRNFVISDSMGATQDIQMEFAGWRSSSVHSMMIAIPGAPNHRYADILGSLVEQQYGLRQENDSFQIVVAAENPRIEVDTRDAALAAGQTARRLLSSGQSAGSLDIAIRYAASELLQRRGRRHLIIASSAGEYLPEFQTYGIIELARYCQINHINVSVLKLGQGEIDDRLQYLVEETGGTVHSDADPKGIAPLMQHGRQMPSGWYSLSYSSLANNDFGRRYLPITVEAMLLQRSGRDELGYFSPLEF
ncbi:MAG: hypothetical protein D6B26_01645 [Spirochaetaceae bacterium]|nr:MAG: hypothetical protein D6B26_01645 [Spirochaetaceae bacterium]